MARKKTHEEFVEKMKSMYPNIKIKTRYTTSNNKISCECCIDGYEWYSSPNQLLKGYGCPICDNRRFRYTTKTLQQKLDKCNKEIDIIGEFKNVNILVECKCRICGHKWNVKPNDLLNGSGCPRCSKCERYSTNTFKEVMDTKNNLIEIMGEYINAFTKIKCKCKVCNHIFYSRPNNLVSGYGCPNCSKSKGETKIERFLLKHNIHFVTQYKSIDLKGVNGGQLSYDFYLPKYNTFIEYQGEFHDGTASIQTDKDLKIQQEHDKRKREYAKEHNIDLLEIWYWDFNNIPNILQEKLHINNNEKSA